MISSQRSRRRPLPALLVALLALAAASTTGIGCGGGAPEEEVWIIGLDGADWDILDPMIARGELPNLARLREEGAYGRLRSVQPLLSPVIWTSIATGKTADEHGVTWFMTDGPDGEKIPVSSRNRWVRALWNMATDRDHSSTVIGWWATWPAEPIDGFLVSDYVGWHSFGVTGQEFDAPGKVWPPDLQSELLGLLPSPDDVDDELLLTMVDLPRDELDFDASRGPFGGPLPHLRQAVATARGYTDIALDLLDRRRTDLFTVYYEGTDAAMHLFMNYAPPQQDWVSDEDFEAFRDAVSGYWQYQDRLLGELLAERTENTTILMVSDHGFRTGDERLREEHFEIELADASHMIDGAIVINGPGIEPGTRLRGADIYDVAPTVLHLMGLPVAEDMEGEVLAQAFTDEFLAARPIETIPTYEIGDWDRGDDVVVDAEAGRNMEEMLRSLGYISGGDGETSSEDAPAASEGEGPAMSVEHAVNLANVLKGQGEIERAVEVLEEQLAAHPDHFEVRLNLAQLLAGRRDFERSFTLFDELRRDRPENMQVIEDYALALGRAGRLEKAQEVYQAGLELDPQWASGLAGLGYTRHLRGDTEEGLADLERAVELDPRLARGHYYLGMVQKAVGRIGPAQENFRRTLELDPTFEEAAVQVAGHLQDQGRLAEARGFLREFMDHVGEAPLVQVEMAVVDLRSGKVDEALPVLEAAARRNPEDADLLGNLGIALAMSGSMDRARETFERVVELDPESAEARAQLGNFYLQAGRVDDAEEQIVEAARLAPEVDQIQLGLATLYHRTGRLDQAIAIYEKVVERDPRNAIALYQLAMATGASGDEEKAMDLLRRARELDPSLPMPGQRRPGGQ